VKSWSFLNKPSINLNWPHIALHQQMCITTWSSTEFFLIQIPFLPSQNMTTSPAEEADLKSPMTS
jgi:hypothetical protein